MAPAAPAQWRRRDGLALGWGAAAPAAWASDDGPLELVYPRLPERPPEAYGYRLLELALTRAGVPHRVRMGGDWVSAQRARVELAAGRVQVLDSGTSPTAERDFDLVPFPLDLGLSGCRLLLARRESLPALAQVRHLDELKRFRIGQGAGWIDTDILRAAGFQVETGQFVPLFRMLQAKRFDLYPLGADEALAMLTRYQSEAPDVVLVDGLALHYPFARVYMLTRGQARLRAALLLGLQRAFADGSLLRVLATQAGLGPVVTGQQALPARILPVPNPWATEVYRAIDPQYLHPKLRPKHPA